MNARVFDTILVLSYLEPIVAGGWFSIRDPLEGSDPASLHGPHVVTLYPAPIGEGDHGGGVTTPPHPPPTTPITGREGQPLPQKSGELDGRRRGAHGPHKVVKVVSQDGDHGDC